MFRLSICCVLSLVVHAVLAQNDLTFPSNSNGFNAGLPGLSGSNGVSGGATVPGLTSSSTFSSSSSSTGSNINFPSIGASSGATNPNFPTLGVTAGGDPNFPTIGSGSGNTQFTSTFQGNGPMNMAGTGSTSNMQFGATNNGQTGVGTVPELSPVTSGQQQTGFGVQNPGFGNVNMAGVQTQGVFSSTNGIQAGPSPFPGQQGLFPQPGMAQPTTGFPQQGIPSQGFPQAQPGFPQPGQQQGQQQGQGVFNQQGSQFGQQQGGVQMNQFRPGMMQQGFNNPNLPPPQLRCHNIQCPAGTQCTLYDPRGDFMCPKWIPILPCACRTGCSVGDLFIRNNMRRRVDSCGSECECRNGQTQCNYIPCPANNNNNGQQTPGQTTGQQGVQPQQQGK